MITSPTSNMQQHRLPYTPVAGYTLRLRADTEITPKGGPVQTWGNTGTTSDVTQATSDARPTLDGGGVLFDGTDDVLAGGLILGDIIDSDGFAIFAAFTPIAWSTAATMGNAHLNHGIIAASSWFGLSMRNVAGAELMLWSVELPNYKGVVLPATLGSRHVVCYRYDGTHIHGSVNGAAEVSAACGHVTASALATALTIGRGYSVFGNVRIFEVLAYDAPLTSDERAANIAGMKVDWVVP